MASSSSTDPLFEQVDLRVTFQNPPDSLNTSNQMMAPDVLQVDVPQANFPMIPEARLTHHHQNPPVAVQNSFQPQNLQSHQEPFNPFHGDSISNDMHSNRNVQNDANNDVQQHLWDLINSVDQGNMAFNHQLMNHEFPLEPQRAPLDQQTPGDLMEMLHQLATGAARDLDLQKTTVNNEPNPDFMNVHNQFTNLQKLILEALSHQGTSSDLHSDQMNHNNMFPFQLTDQMLKQLALGLYQNYLTNLNASAQQNLVASSATPNPITFFLLNSETWQYLNSITNEMMVTNDGRGIFPRFEIEIRNLNPTASYHVGIKLQLVSPKKFSYNAERYEWMEVDRRTFEELPEQETNEILTPVQTGQEIMEKGLKLKTVNIYSIGNEKKKRSATKSIMTEERIKKIEQKERTRRQTMIRVFSQHKYMPIFTLFRLTDFEVSETMTTAQFPETKFITTTEYKNEAVKKWKTDNNPYVRSSYRTSKTGIVDTL